MNLDIRKRIVIVLAASGLLATGMFLFLNGTRQIACADPETLFVRVSGSGTACTQAQPCALQTALAQATGGDTIYLAEGTYTGGGGAVVTITQGIALYGGWDGASSGPPACDPDANPTTLDGEGGRRGVHIGGDITVTLEGLRITRGDGTGLGGNIQPWRSAGGGIYAITAAVTISDCEIWDNQAGEWGGFGGGVYIEASSGVLIQNNDIHHNDGGGRGDVGGGGGVEINGGHHVTLRNNVIRENLATGVAGSLGGGVALGCSECLVEGNLILSNTAGISYTGSGGGVYINGGRDITLRDNRIIGNVAGQSSAAFGAGGGVYISSCSPFTLVNNVIAGNSASDGSGLRVYGFSYAPSSGHLLHTTVTSNVRGPAVQIGESSIGYYVTLALTNTIIAGHDVGFEAVSGSTATLHATLWWDNDQNIVGSHVQHADDHDGDPRFASDGYHLLPGSAAIDQGENAGVTTDMDGETRPYGSGYDLGADEFVVIAVTRAHIAGPTVGFSGTLSTFSAVVTPVNATPPITYTWSPEPVRGQSTAQACYRWHQTGTQFITLTVSNYGSTAPVTDTHEITVVEGVHLYLPLTMRQMRIFSILWGRLSSLPPGQARKPAPHTVAPTYRENT